MTRRIQASRFDRALKPVHRWVWRHDGRRARKLLSFARTEADGGRDLAQAAERTPDARLRRLYLRHALDEQRHAELFRRRAHAILAEHARGDAPSAFEANWFSPGERGLDDLAVDEMPDESLLAFLHLSEKAAAGRFTLYRDVVSDDITRDLFGQILRDEAFHMNYTGAQLARVAQDRRHKRLWRARMSRLWKAYLRIAVALASLIGKVVLIVQYFVLLPVFALLARRAARREPVGWATVPVRTDPTERSQY